LLTYLSKCSTLSLHDALPIYEKGGLLGKRKIEILKADEAAGTDANTKEMRRLKLSEKIDMFMGITSSGNTPALGPVAEELKLLTDRKSTRLNSSHQIISYAVF